MGEPLLLYGPLAWCAWMSLAWSVRTRFEGALLEGQDHLRCRGIPTPRVVLSEAGERCVESGPASLWVMFHFVEGQHYRYDSRAQLRHAARCLAGIHAAGADFTAVLAPRQC